jgi:hypothetical protein
MTRVAFRGRTDEGAIDLAPKEEKNAQQADEAPLPPELVVCASGNLALIYFPRIAGRVALEEMDARWPGMVASLLAHPGIGLLMGRSSERGAMVMGKSGIHYLADGTITGVDPMKPFGPYAEAGMRRVDGMTHCPDLVAISLLDTATDEVAAFEELIGSHGGLGGTQTQPFILHPSDWTIDEPIIGAENVYWQIRRWLESVGINLGKQPQTTVGTGAQAEAVTDS